MHEKSHCLSIRPSQELSIALIDRTFLHDVHNKGAFLAVHLANSCLSSQHLESIQALLHHMNIYTVQSIHVIGRLVVASIYLTRRACYSARLLDIDISIH